MLYNIFCSDLPEVVHDNHENTDDNNDENKDYEMNYTCKKCGKIVCYADDCTYCVSDKNPRILENKIEESFQKISNYMNSNKLFLNSDKTHLLVF